MQNVLMIDDSKTVVLAVTRYLAQHGYQVTVAQTFVEIPKVISQINPAAIILDLNMPTLSGEQIGRFLKRQKYTGKIVIYSGENGDKLASAARDIGACCSVPKGADLEPLLKALQNCAGPQAPTKAPHAG